MLLGLYNKKLQFCVKTGFQEQRDHQRLLTGCEMVGFIRGIGVRNLADCHNETA